MERIDERASARAADVVTQEELRQLRDAAMFAWQASRRVHEAIRRIDERISAGADVEQGNLYYAPEIGMVMDSSPRKKLRRRAQGA